MVYRDDESGRWGNANNPTAQGHKEHLMSANQSTSPELATAITTYLARRDRTTHPDGSFDRKSRWYPSDDERRPCCDLVRSPSVAYPYSLMTHCRSVEHVARLFDVEASAIRKATRLAHHTPEVCHDR